MAKLDVMKALRENKGKIDIRYSLSIGQVKEIESNSTGKYDMICNFFDIGFIQGKKAAMAEIKKGRIQNG